MKNYFEIAKKISSDLECEMKNRNIKAIDVSNSIGVSPEYFSKMRVEMRGGKLPSIKFLIGISLYFKKNFIFSER